MTVQARIKGGVRGAIRTGVALATAPARRRDGLAPPTTRAALLATAPSDVDALEIGPFQAPQLHGPRVRYFDVLDQAGLRARAVEHGRDPAGCPPIDYVSPVGDLSVIGDDRFDVVFSSHTIEHQPDLIAHLQAVGTLLRPGGRYIMIVPDRRYCFDHYNPASTLAQVEAAHAERRTLHTPEAVRTHFEGMTHNNPIRHWLGQHGAPAGEGGPEERAALAAAVADLAAGRYVDVHAWMFDPASFLGLTEALWDAGTVPLRPERVHATAALDGEFFAVLVRPAA